MRAAVIGTNWGRVHTHALRDAGVDVVVLCGRDDEKTRRVAAEDGIGAWVTHPEDLVAFAPDLVMIATPAATHAGLLERFAHVPVVCEKPVVGYRGPDLTPAARRGVFVNYAFAFLDSAADLGAAMDKMTAIESVTVDCEVNLPLPMDGAALFLEVASHPLSWLVHRFGAPQAFGGHVDGADTILRVRFGNGATGVVRCRRTGAEGIRHRLVVRGAGTQAELRGSFSPDCPWRYAPVTVNGSPVGSGEAPPTDCWLRANHRSLHAIVDVLRGRRTVDEGLRSGLFDIDKAIVIDECVTAAL